MNQTMGAAPSFYGYTTIARCRVMPQGSRHLPFKLILALALVPSATVDAQAAANVLLVVNDNSQLSRKIAEYYAHRRTIPPKNVCHIRTDPQEEISRAQYDREIAGPIAACLNRNQLNEQVLYIATTAGVPLRIAGVQDLDGDVSAVDSELTLLYTDRIQGHPHPVKGGVPNPLFRQTKRQILPISEFPIYLVTRLAAYR